MSTDELTSSNFELQIEETKDGSPTLFVPSLVEHYHSTYGARTESEYIFIGQGLREWRTRDMKPCTILEVGFGTGLNALLTLLEAEKTGLQILYHTFEINPIAESLVEKLWEKSLPEKEWLLMKEIHSADWDKAVPLTERFTLFKHNADLLQSDLPMADVIYMDAFAPEKTPDLWSLDFLRKLFDSAKDDARLSTYCAKGEIRRRLQSVGFLVHRTPGPPGGKREILTAVKK